ncbi:uncharacterized protein LOC109525283 isoform X2 [Hippocampus comes]|uniref:uncharacterized protein LOC109525283 isoform X2 n=1 Tax=Hippocampus comes TaxID=109280 RepID=UPI00094E39B8|nr:PREDICTED: uncharacterized protein LOC109525283 isoform X2 [Hippocampus comes]
MLKELVRERLVAAADEIFGLFESTIASYEEQLCRAREENEGQRRQLEAVYKSHMLLHRQDGQLLIACPEILPPEAQGESSNMECSRLPRVKEEEEEADVSKLPPTDVLVTSDDDEEKPPECSQSLPRHLVPSGDRAGGPPPENVLTPPSHSDNTTDMTEADCKGMLVQVEHGGVQKWVQVPIQEDCYDYSKFIQEVSAKFNLPNGAHVDLKDSSGVDVDADIFDKLLKFAPVSFKVSTGHAAENKLAEACSCSFTPTKPDASSSSRSPTENSASALIVDGKRRKRSLAEGPPDSGSARDVVYNALCHKAGGDDICEEYDKTQGLSDRTRKKLVNILVEDMMDAHGRVPPVDVRMTYALGIVTLFPNLKDHSSPTGFEHYYDCRSGQGYLAYRLKTVQRNSASKSKTSARPALEKQIKMSARPAFEGGPKTLRLGARSGQLSGDQCTEAIFAMKQSPEPSLVREKMKATLEHRQKMLRDLGQSSLVLDHFPRFLDTPGLAFPVLDRARFQRALRRRRLWQVCGKMADFLQAEGHRRLQKPSSRRSSGRASLCSGTIERFRMGQRLGSDPLARSSLTSDRKREKARQNQCLRSR